MLTTTITRLTYPAYRVEFACADCGKRHTFETPAQELPVVLATLYRDGLPPVCDTCLLHEGE
jgi:acetone carboxylase gamma subunit